MGLFLVEIYSGQGKKSREESLMAGQFYNAELR